MNGKIEAKEKPPKTAAEPSKVNMEEPNFTHVAELASEVRSTERVPQNLHEEESVTAQESTIRGLTDQIVVSELTEDAMDKGIVIDKNGAEKIDELVDKKTSEILRKVENVSADVAKDLKEFAKGVRAAAEASVEQKVDKAAAGIQHAVDEVLHKADEVKSDAANFVSRLGSATADTVAAAHHDAKEELKNAAQGSEAGTAATKT